MMVLILSRNKITPEAVIDPVAQNLEAAGHWRRASTRWLLVMGDFECTEAQREWLLLRRNYCLAQISSPGASKAGYQQRDEMRGACT
ncbi:PerC family transcriptional regulator [Salmonella enterica subsp. enterica serovar Stanley]|nr:PerC family transcriptional regulator [Salmonella enterica subsp. enterica serovar Stanley]EBX5996968.1 PerC family transcriptional regulator [Salmonella enterica subsp. enterica serovar Stanley]ECM0375676.1 PerC family transcriptional regulator [Salmonella enterica subsp. enterica serovar Newport]